MNGLGDMVTVLTLVFTLCLLLLLLQFAYVLWRRRRFRKRNLAASCGQELAGESFESHSKELLYFFCWKSQSRVEPDATQPDSNGVAPPLEEDDVLKGQGLSRFLFTIKEEEREEMDSENGFSAENIGSNKRASSESGNLFSAENEVSMVRPCLDESSVAVTVEVDEETPFSTPCASPPYYTPSPSPTRKVLERSEDIKTVSFVSLEVDRK